MEGLMNPLKNIRKPSVSAARERRLEPGEYEKIVSANFSAHSATALKERNIGVHLWRWTPMQETRIDSEFHLVVTGTRRDGRRRYDEDSKQALVRACLQPGVSLAGMALKHGVNANLLRKWVLGYQLERWARLPCRPQRRWMRSSQ
jgi:hypothetical protein